MFPLWCSVIWSQRVHSVLIKLVFWLIFPNSPDLDSDSEGSQHSTESVHSEKTLLEKLEIMTNQGLIQVVKVFLDWLRTNTDIILMCAQVRWQIFPALFTKCWRFRIVFHKLIICVLCRVPKACGTDCLCCWTCYQMAASCSRLVSYCTAQRFLLVSTAVRFWHFFPPVSLKIKI